MLNPMKDENYYSQVACQMLFAHLVTGDESASLSLLQDHFPVLALSDEQLSVELEAVLIAYKKLLSQLDIFAAAKRPEFFGVRQLILQAVEKRLANERQTP